MLPRLPLCFPILHRRPRRPTPSHLPPELLREVFTFVGYSPDDLPSYCSHIKPLIDLYSCSLVCRAWHDEALSLLPPSFLHRITILGSHITLSERLLTLLATSRRLGLSHYARISYLEIDLGWVYTPHEARRGQTRRFYAEERERLLRVAVRLLTPGLQELRFCMWRRAALYDPAVCRLLRRLAPLCRGVHKIEIFVWYIVGGYSPMRISPFVDYRAVFVDGKEVEAEGRAGSDAAEMEEEAEYFENEWWWGAMKRDVRACAEAGAKEVDGDGVKGLEWVSRLVDWV